MKIVMLGNMNNMFFSLARYVRDIGFEVDVLIFDDEPAHFSPEGDTYSSDYRSYTRHVTWGDPANILKLDRQAVSQELNGYDLIIGMGTAPAICNIIGRKLDLFVPYGYDIYSLPFYKIVRPKNILAYWYTAYKQRKALRDVPYYMMAQTNARFEKLVAGIGIKGRRFNVSPPMLYVNEYTRENLEAHMDQYPLAQQMTKLKETNDFVFMQHIRQCWKSGLNDWSRKGNDMLINAYSRFCSANRDVTSVLVLFEYGVDVDASKGLIEELNIADKVLWVPKMPRKHVMQTLSFADLVVGELFSSWLTYGALSEALALGIPFMHKRNDEEYKDHYDELYPMIYADSMDTVLANLNDYVQRPEYYKAQGNAGKDWFVKYCITEPLDNISFIINQHKLEKSH